MAPVIRISEKNWSRLKMWAEPLEDSADDALGKILDAVETHRDSLILDQSLIPDQSLNYGHRESLTILNAEEQTGQDAPANDNIIDANSAIGNDAPKTNTGRLPRGQAVPREAYLEPIIEVLYERGGMASGKDVLEIVKQRTKHLLSDVDYELVNGNIPRWRKGAQWTRQTLIKQGLLKDDSPRGIWELTEQGVAEVATKRR